MRTLFLATAAFAALVIVAPIGKAHQFQSITDARSAAMKACVPLSQVKPFKWTGQIALIDHLMGAGHGDIVRAETEAQMDHEDPPDDKVAHIAAYAVQGLKDAADACVGMAGGK